MTANHDDFEFEGLYCFRAEAENTYFFLPLKPRPETDGAGNPTMMAFAIRNAGFVQLGITLEADENTLTALRRQLAQRLNLPSPDDVRLCMTPLATVSAVLLITDDDETQQEVGRSSTSGFPPYTALFHSSLSKTQYQAVTSAMKGKQEHVHAGYEVELLKPVTVRTLLVGDVKEVLKGLSAVQMDAGVKTALRQLLDDALAKHRLHFELKAGEDAPPEMLEQAKIRVFDAAVEVLHTQMRNPTPPDEASVLTSIELKADVTQTKRLLTDVAEWFMQGTPSA